MKSGMQAGTALLAAMLSLSLAHASASEDPWAKVERAALEVFDYDDALDLDLQEVGTEELEGCTVIDAHFASPDGGRVPAYLYVPHGDGPHAGLVFMHGLPGDRTNFREVAIDYARAGAMGIAISAPWARENGGPPVHFSEQDRRNQIQLIHDLRRAVDILEAEPNVDPDRIGYVGGSYGGAMGGLLAGVEHRIQAYVLMIGDGGLVCHFTGTEDEGGRLDRMETAERDAWLQSMRPIEPLLFVGDAAPSQLLFQNGKTDEAVPAGDARRFIEAGSEPKTVKWYDHGHNISREMLLDQVVWLSERIGIDDASFKKKLAQP